MLKPLIIGLTLSAFLAGCGAIRSSPVNPLNWFGRSQAEQPAASTDVEEINPLIPAQRGLFAQRRAAEKAIDLTTPIDQVTALTVERIPGGAIIRATGVDVAQGSFDVELVPEFEEELPVDGVLTYTLERQQTAGARAGGAVHTREVVVARRLTDQQLRGVRSIRIVAQSNSRIIRR